MGIRGSEGKQLDRTQRSCVPQIAEFSGVTAWTIAAPKGNPNFSFAPSPRLAHGLPNGIVVVARGRFAWCWLGSSKQLGSVDPEKIQAGFRSLPVSPVVIGGRSDFLLAAAEL